MSQISHKNHTSKVSTEVKAVTVTVTAKSDVLTCTSSKALADAPEATFTALVAHFQSDGSTERIKHTITNILRQFVGIHQTLVSKLLLGFPIDFKFVKSYMPGLGTERGIHFFDEILINMLVVLRRKFVIRSAYDIVIIVHTKQTRD